MIDNGRRASLIIEGVFDGIAGVSGDTLAFVPNLIARRPADARGALLDGRPIRIAPRKDITGAFWCSRFEVLS
ncbi:MAG: hypothetical protein E6Q40_04535 [Cupriavidus sp.]|nr:MAG: hypothetical protein E6Q40_04535 [Cupriavidus sp.]